MWKERNKGNESHEYTLANQNHKKNNLKPDYRRRQEKSKISTPEVILQHNRVNPHSCRKPRASTRAARWQSRKPSSGEPGQKEKWAGLRTGPSPDLILMQRCVECYGSQKRSYIDDYNFYRKTLKETWLWMWASLINNELSKVLKRTCFLGRVIHVMNDREDAAPPSETI